VRRVIRKVGVFSLASEAVAAVMPTARFANGYHHSMPSAAYFRLFHAVSAFNNAGFGREPDSLVQYVADRGSA
jgi:trk system potassium uptake protein TrkH